ncbi:MAG TPA: MauE/DoxX family redox-associated membrane protein [Marmoricola sp.]|nr:MauE/DoxX family redox-associated membrane protein [Marmoricola sp.]
MKRWIGFLARLVVGAVWLAAGYEKFSDPAGTVRAVRAFQLLPESVVPTFGHLLPVAEIVMGVCLLVGVLTRVSAVVSATLLFAFIVGISLAWARGLEIQCGCFGGGGYTENAAAGYVRDIIRDLGLVLASAWLVWLPRTPLAVDNVLFPTTERLTDGEEGLEPVED